MPEFDYIISDDCIDVYEGDECADYYAIDSFVMDEGSFSDDSDDISFTVEDEEPPEIDMNIDMLPGAEVQFVQYVEDEKVVEEVSWEKSKKPEHFMAWAHEQLQNIPQHSGKTISGSERALSFLKDLSNKASQAMKADLYGAIDEMELDTLRKDIQKMIDRLENHIERLQKNASVRFIVDGVCKACDSSAPVWTDPATNSHVCLACDSKVDTDDLQKTAGTPAVSVYMTPFERAVVSTIINATVSGGRNIEESYLKMKNKYDFTPREEMSFQQLISDHGYPIIKDRGLINEPSDPASGDGMDFSTQYHA